jgi:hypothetical protein
LARPDVGCECQNDGGSAKSYCQPPVSDGAAEPQRAAKGDDPGLPPRPEEHDPIWPQKVQTDVYCESEQENQPAGDADEQYQRRRDEREAGSANQ